MTTTTTKPKRTAGQKKSQQQATRVRKAAGNHRSRSATGVIHAGEALTVPAFLERMGTTRSHLSEMRQRAKEMGVTLARRDGGKNVVIHGADYLAYVAKLPEAVLD